jgi:Protein of unknown function (DUF3089)
MSIASRVQLFAVTALLLGLAAVPATASAKTHWLCRPGLAKNPCTPGLSTTVYSPDSKELRVEHPKTDAKLRADCFYVYPTVSDQKTTLANFEVDDVLRSIALYQAARYSQHCRVFAPTYRQVTITTLNKTGTETAQQLATGTNDVRKAFADYLKHDNKGRPFVLIGHSQGSFVLRTLIAKDVDTKSAVRKRMLSAILMGGNVLVKKGSGVGGDFKHVKACRSTSQLGCVVAFSTFDTPVPANTKFGAHAPSGQQVLCTNPASLKGGSGRLDTILPSAPFAPGSTIALGTQLLGLKQPTPSTVWSREPTAYKGKCSSADGANVLQITPAPTAQVPKPSPDPTWGLHLLDANIGLGNLVSLVASETKAYRKAH